MGRKVTWMNEEFDNIDTAASIEEIRAGMVRMYPAIVDAVASEDREGNVAFTLSTGDKG